LNASKPFTLKTAALLTAAASLVCSLSGQAAEPKDFYASGKVSMRETLRLDEGSMPDDVFFEMTMDAVSDTQGNVYLADYKAHRIYKFAPSGEFVSSFGREGQGPGDLSGPAYIAAAGDRIMVYEIRNRRFSFFDLNGKFLSHHAESGLGYRIQKMRGLPNGDFVLEWDITDFSQSDTPQDCLIEIRGPDMKIKNTLIKDRIHLQKIIREPVRTNIPLPFPKRYHWEVSPQGHIIVGFSGKYEIDIFDLAGEKIRSFSRPHTPLPVTKQNQREFYDRLSFAASDGTRLKEPPGYVKEHIVFPSEKPVFWDILVDGRGNILVCPYMKTMAEEWRTFDAFDPEGRFIATVRIEGEAPQPFSSRLRLDKDCFWWCHTDAEGLPVVSKWEIVRVS
jgi:hypothetical protein